MSNIKTSDVLKIVVTAKELCRLMSHDLDKKRDAALELNQPETAELFKLYGKTTVDVFCMLDEAIHLIESEINQ